MEISSLTTFELQKRFASNKPTRAILPIGAIEQHGPFLPITTDTIIAEGVSHRIDQEFKGECFIYPSLYFANTDACKNYIGTITISHDLFRQLLTQVISNFAAHGFDDIIIVNGHGINEASINELVFAHNLGEKEKFGEYKHKAVAVHAYKYYKRMEQKFELTTGKHADWIENLLVEQILKKRGFPNKYLLYSDREAKEASDMLAVEESSVLGEFVENRSRQGVIGKSLPGRELSDKETREIFETIVSDLLSDVKNKLLIKDNISVY